MSDSDSDSHQQSLTAQRYVDKSFLYQRKYYMLKQKCDEIQQTNEKLVNRIQHVKKILKRHKKAKKFIMMKLDAYGDNYMDLYMPAMFDDVSTRNTLLHSPINQRTPTDFLSTSNMIDDQKPPLNVNPFVTSSAKSTSISDNGR